MSTPTPAGDVGFQLASTLLGYMLTRMVAAGCEPGKSFVADGASVPAEDCCQGVAWTRVAQAMPTDGSGNQYGDMRNAPQGPSGHQLTLEAGMLRCTPILDDLGNAPPAAEYTAAALLNSLDRDALRKAILWDLPASIGAVGADGFIPSEWQPIDAGGCGGGFMTVRIGTTMVL